MYSFFRRKYEDDLIDLEKERTKILKSKKPKFKIVRRLKSNSISQIRLICSGIKETWKVFEK